MSDKKNESESVSLEFPIVIDFEQVEQVSRVFFEESKEILNDLDYLILRLEQDPSDHEQVNVLFRKVHTIKGSVGAVPGGQLIGSLAHEFEALLLSIKHGQQVPTKECFDLFLRSSRILKVLSEALREKRDLYSEELSEAIELIASYGSCKKIGNLEDQGSTSTSLSTPNSKDGESEGVWISKEQFNQFMSLSGELLVVKNLFQMIQQTVNFRLQPDLFERRQNEFSHSLSKVCDQFQSQVQIVQKEKVSESFEGLAILVRQVSAELNKNVQLEIIGDDLLIDKGLGKDLYESLVHIVRNSIDHGIEDQLERAIHGKSPVGKLTLEVCEKNGKIHVVYNDDGKGLDKEKILKKALGLGMVSKELALSLSEDEIYRFVFNAGFSTKEKVTTMSGRGVGMDVVLSMIEKYNGLIAIENSPGHGLCFRIEMPVPQHILVESVLLCSWDDYKFAVPLTSVIHLSSCKELQFTIVDHMRYCQFGGVTVPLLNYREMMNLKMMSEEESVNLSSAIFIKVRGLVIALMVHRIEAQADLVVKSFGKFIGSQKGCKGVSILADENIVYILDPEKMITLFYNSESRMKKEAA